MSKETYCSVKRDLAQPYDKCLYVSVCMCMYFHMLMQTSVYGRTHTVGICTHVGKGCTHTHTHTHTQSHTHTHTRISNRELVAVYQVQPHPSVKRDLLVSKETYSLLSIKCSLIPDVGIILSYIHTYMHTYIHTYIQTSCITNTNTHTRTRTRTHISTEYQYE